MASSELLTPSGELIAFHTPVFASRLEARRSLLSAANPSVRAAFRTPADQAA